MLEAEKKAKPHDAIMDLEEPDAALPGGALVPRPGDAHPGPGPGPAIPAAPVLAVELGPMAFRFAFGDREISVHLDGFSHTSRIRRAYAKCACDGHVDCYKYTSLARWPLPWHGVAFVLAYMRQGLGLPDKAAHVETGDPDMLVVEAMLDEMLAILVAPDFPVALP